MTLRTLPLKWLCERLLDILQYLLSRVCDLRSDLQIDGDRKCQHTCLRATGESAYSDAQGESRYQVLTELYPPLTVTVERLDQCNTN